MEVTTLINPQIDHGKLAEAREERGFTQAQVARLLGYDRRQIWQFEKGKGLTLENFTRLMMFYDKPFKYFLKNE